MSVSLREGGATSLLLHQVLYRHDGGSHLVTESAASITVGNGPRWCSPAYLFGLRVWPALAPTGIALGALGVAAGVRPGAGLPQVPQMVTGVALSVALGAAALLATGTAVRLMALGLIVLVPLGQITGAVDARLPWALLLVILVLHGAGWLRRSTGPGCRMSSFWATAWRGRDGARAA